jgi:hypothetical protein
LRRPARACAPSPDRSSRGGRLRRGDYGAIVRSLAGAPAPPHRSVGRLDGARETDFVHQRTRPEFIAQRGLDLGEPPRVGRQARRLLDIFGFARGDPLPMAVRRQDGRAETSGRRA